MSPKYKQDCFIIDAFGSPACDYEHSGIEKLKANGVKVYLEWALRKNLCKNNCNKTS